MHNKAIWTVLVCTIVVVQAGTVFANLPDTDTWKTKPHYVGRPPKNGYKLDAHLGDIQQTIMELPGMFRRVEDQRDDEDASFVMHFMHNTTLGPYERKGTFPQPQGVNIWIPITGTLNLGNYTHLRFRARIDGPAASYLNLGLVNMAVNYRKSTPQVKQQITGVSVNVPLDAGDWSWYCLPLAGCTDDIGRYLHIHVHNCGHLPDDPAITDIYCTDFTLTNEPLRQDVGWGIDPTIIAIPQTGFRPHHPKRGLLSTESDHTSFVVRNLDTGKVVYQGQTQKVVSAIGRTKVLDFTAVATSGRYRIEAGTITSLPFVIGEHAYESCVRLLSDWIFNMRCGCRTAYHQPCHLDDAWFYPDSPDGGEATGEPIHVNSVGGWHDAGDQRCYYSYPAEMVGSAVATYDAGWRRDRDHDGVDDSVDKALWGLNSYLRQRNPADGRMFASIWHEGGDFRRGCYWTDNVTGSDDDRRVVHHIWSVNIFAKMCWSAGVFIDRFGNTYPDLKEQLLSAIAPQWEYWFDDKTGRALKPIYSIWTSALEGHSARNMAYYGKGALGLYLASGKTKTKYLDFARRAANRLVLAQRHEFFSEKRLCGEIFFDNRDDRDRYIPHEFLAEMVLCLPDDPDWPKWRAALVRASEWWLKPTRSEFAPFSLPTMELPQNKFTPGSFGVLIDKKDSLRIVPYATAQMTGCTAYAMSRVACALGDVELQSLARDQVHWTVGYNPFNVSFICGYGDDCLDQFYSFTQGRMIGCTGTGYGMEKACRLPANIYGVPSVVRPQGSEPWTQGAERLLRAMAAVTEPAKISLTFRKGDSAWDKEIVVRWPVTSEVVFRGTPDAVGSLEEFELNGGQRYIIETGGIQWYLPVFDGYVHTRTFDLNHLVTVSAECPEDLYECDTYQLRLAVRNIGLVDTAVHLAVYAENARMTMSHTNIMVAAGQQENIMLPFVAGRRDRPCVILVVPDDDKSRCVDITRPVTTKSIIIRDNFDRPDTIYTSTNPASSPKNMK